MVVIKQQRKDGDNRFPKQNLLLALARSFFDRLLSLGSSLARPVTREVSVRTASSCCVPDHPGQEIKTPSPPKYRKIDWERLAT